MLSFLQYICFVGWSFSYLLSGSPNTLANFSAERKTEEDFLFHYHFD